jgi:hypothetical protein
VTVTLLEPAVRFSTAVKWQAREHTLINAIHKSGIVNPRIMSLAGRQGGEYAENLQLQQRCNLSPFDYIGVDRHEGIILHNLTRFPLCQWECGDIVSEVANTERDERPLVVYLDFTGIANVFFTQYAGNVTSPYNPDVLRFLMKDYPGILPRVMRYLRKGDIVVVNVPTHGRHLIHLDLKGRRWIDSLLDSNPGWVWKPWMSGSSKNLALPSRGPCAKVYKYKSTVKGAGTMWTFTSFALSNEGR